MKTQLILAFVFAGFLQTACSQNKSVSLSDEKVEAELQKIEVDQANKVEEATAEEDSVGKCPLTQPF